MKKKIIETLAHIAWYVALVLIVKLLLDDFHTVRAMIVGIAGLIAPIVLWDLKQTRKMEEEKLFQL